MEVTDHETTDMVSTLSALNYASPYWRNARVIGEIKTGDIKVGGKWAKTFRRNLVFVKFQ